MKKNQTDTTELSKKDQIIDQAYKIFYSNGFHASGLELLLEGSGISKRTLYKYFSSKEDLIAATIEHYKKQMEELLAKEITSLKMSSEEKILKLFDVEEEFLKDQDFCGCFAVKALLEYDNKNPQIERACDLFFQGIENYFNAHSSKKIGPQIFIIFRGAIITAQDKKSTLPFKHAKEIVKLLL